jgi:NAD(P)H-dependent FMN reductase
MRILLISGSTRDGSSNTLALCKLHALAHPDVTTEFYVGLRQLPAFVPGMDPPPGPVIELLSQVQNADAVVFSTPEYAGGLPGSLKNLLDWTVGGGQLYQKPVGWLDVANPGRGGGARTQLRTVLEYVGARVIDAACVHVPLGGDLDPLPISSAQEQALTIAQCALVAAVKETSNAG